MRASRYFLATLKEAPSDAELISHKLMVRAGLIRRLAGGIYTWMPLGLRVVRKVEAIVREEMNRAGAIELFMPAVQPAELWQESGRWQKYGPELLRIKDRHDRDFCVGPTHEEVITDVARREIRSYRQLPVHFYQIQTKFRDEIRPRFGVMRGREFTMKDGYSFHADYADLQREYRNMYDTYTRIFTPPRAEIPRGLRRPGRDRRHRVAGVPRARRFRRGRHRLLSELRLRGERRARGGAGAQRAAKAPAETMKKVPTPGKTRCEDVAQLLGLPLERTVEGDRGRARRGILAAAASRRPLAERDQGAEGPGLDPFRFASDAEIERNLGCKPGYIGPGRSSAQESGSSPTARSPR